MECFNCGASGDKVLLFDGISSKGIVKICEKCSEEEDIPIINKPLESEINKYRKKLKPVQSIKRSVVYDKLSQMSGIDVKDGREKDDELIKKEVVLKQIADKNFEDSIPEQKPKTHLVDNFHWIIMRTRRLKKMTQKKLAEEIAEPEAAIKMAEKGILPEDDKKLIIKIENKLGIRLIKEEFREKPKEKEEIKFIPEKIDFKSDETKTLTISDLQEMKKQRELGILGATKSQAAQERRRRGEDFVGFDKSIKEKINFNEEAKEDEPEFIKDEKEKNSEETNEKDLSGKEIDDLIFGRK